MRAVVRDQRGLSKEVPISQVDEVTGLTGLGRLVQKMHSQPTWLTACPCCGWTRKQAVETTLMGCGYCYVTLWPVKRSSDKV